MIIIRGKNDYDPVTWNLNAFVDDEDILINRTNNLLKQYNIEH